MGVPRSSEESSETAATVRDPVAALDRFCLAHDELFVIPVDELSEAGVSERFAAVLLAERGVTPAWVSSFSAAFSTYWERAADLYARAPDAWFPPRLQNVCIVTDRERARPYHQPLFKASWSLDVSDFDPELSNVEFGAYQLLHAERLATSRDMAQAVISGLSYWLVRSQSEIEQFAAAAKASVRPDAGVFVRLAESMSWVQTLFHPRLKPPPNGDTTGMRPVVDGSLLVPEAAQAPLRQLVPDLRGEAAAVVKRYQDGLASAVTGAPTEGGGAAPGLGKAIAAWISELRPGVLVTDENGATLWDPETPAEGDALAQALEGVPYRVAQSLWADIKVVGEATDRFLGSLKNVDALPLTTGEVDQVGGVYLHDKRRIVVYCLAQPGLDVRREEAPAYHRLLLAARTIHEWGHLADEAGWLGVPAEQEAEYEKARARISDAVNAIITNAPAGFARGAAEHAKAVGKTTAEIVYDLLQYRMPDYVSNMLARRYLSPSELEAYVRANVHPHFDEELTPPQLLARYAFEYQYLGLGLAEDPLRYFLKSTWFSTYVVETGVIELARLEELFGAVAALCDCYRIDESVFV